MQYMGSKNRLSNDIVPILQQYLTDCNINTYIEPFVGGANIIDKINCRIKIGYDSHEYLIALLNQARENTAVFPQSISCEEYYKVKEYIEDYPKWYVGLVGFCGSYSAKWFGGYAKGNDTRDRQNEAIRNLINQSTKLQNTKFITSDFRDIQVYSTAVIYCDPPYKDTTKYRDSFPYEEYYDWVREKSKENIVLCSEYWMPDDFKCIWEKKHKTLIDSNRTAESKDNIRIEKLFIHRN